MNGPDTQQQIRTAGFRLTAPRRAVLETLQSHHQPLTAKDIHIRLRGRIDLVSVYRTLHLLCRIGAAFEDDFGGKKRYYVDNKQHHHITCRRCGVTECVPCTHEPVRTKRFKDITHQLRMTGICASCAV